MEQQYLPQEEISSSIKPLDAFESQKEETEAETLMEREFSSDAAALTTLLQQEARSRRNETLTTFVWAGIFIAAMMTAANLPESLATIKVAFLFMMAMGIGICLQLARRSYRRKHSFAHALTQVKRVDQVGPLVQTLQVQNTPIRNLAKQTLIGLLPTLQATDAPLLGEHERKILLRQLAISPNEKGHRDLTELFSRAAYRREVDLRVAILKALEQVGSVRELPAVQRLARASSLPHITSPYPHEIVYAARECLPFLQSRVSEQRASEQLLRPSSMQDTSNDLLLRPAASGADALPEQLLRASEPRP